MANDIALPGAGSIVSTEEIAAHHVQRIKVITGAAGVDGGDVGEANPLPVSAQAVKGVLVDRGGTVTTGGASKLLMAANAARRYLMIQNPGDASESIFLTFGATAAAIGDPTAIELGPLGSFTLESGFVTTEAVNVTAATAGHRYIAKEA